MQLNSTELNSMSSWVELRRYKRALRRRREPLANMHSLWDPYNSNARISPNVNVLQKQNAHWKSET